jgi:multiple sugar transport system permease protein
MTFDMFVHRHSLRRRLSNGLLYLALAVFALLCLFPFIWTVSTSMKLGRDTYAMPPRFIPENPTGEGWRLVLLDPRTPAAFARTFVLAGGGTLVATVLSLLPAYGMSRFVFRGMLALRVSITATQMVPVIFLLVPLYSMMNAAGLYDTVHGLLVLHSLFQVPFISMMLHAYINGIPEVLDEAALIDGCSRIGALFKVVLPVTIPGIMGTAAFAFMAIWGDFLIATIMLRSFDNAPLMLLLGQLGRKAGPFHQLANVQAVGALMASVPLVALWIFGQRWMKAGVAQGIT